MCGSGQGDLLESPGLPAKGPGCQERRRAGSGVDVAAAGSRAPPGGIGSQVWALGCRMGLGAAAAQGHLHRARKPGLGHLGKGFLGV